MSCPAGKCKLNTEKVHSAAIFLGICYLLIVNNYLNKIKYKLTCIYSN